MHLPPSLRPLLAVVVAAIGVVVLLAFAAGLLTPDLDAPPPHIDAADLERVTDLRQATFDPDNPPVLWQNVDYSAGNAAAWWPKGEAPVLAGLTGAGKLPPVAERTGSEPLVLAGSDGIGRYGGTWFRLASSIGDTGVMGWRLSGATAVRWSPMGYPVVPHVVKSFAVNEDSTVFTMTLRQGMRWSDGHPFTTEDIRFWWEEDTLGSNEEKRALRDKGQITSGPRWMRAGDAYGTIEIVDDTTYRYVFPEPHPLFLDYLAKAHTWCMPAHYFKPLHPIIGDATKIEAECLKRNIDPERRTVLYNNLKKHTNPHHPRLWAWVLRNETTKAPYVWVRNPYFFAVDPAGNQLPYLDQIHFDEKQINLIPTAASQGQLSMQRRHIPLDSYTLLMNGRAEGGYEVYHWYPATRSPFTIFPNMNRRIDAEEPATRTKAELLQDKRFRQALSLAIDRDTIVKVYYGGAAEPAQLDPGPDSPWHVPELYKAFTDHDPERANALLDELGLTERDSEGMRLTPDGERLTFYLNTCNEWTGVGPSPFLIKDWSTVGLRVILRDRARSLFMSEYNGLAHDLTVWTGESEFLPLLEPRNFAPTAEHSFFSRAWAMWYIHNGMSGDPVALKQVMESGGQILPEDHPLHANLIDLAAISRTPDVAEQRELWRRISLRCAEHIFTISICTHPPQPVIVKNGFANVPELALDGAGFYTPGNAGIETYFWSDPEAPAATLSDGAKEQLSTAMLSATDRYETVTTNEDGSTTTTATGGWSIGAVIIILFWGSVVCIVLAMALRHPFVMRRLLIMVPTLLLISIIGFTVIKLPPGDFLQTRIAELKMKGDDASLEQVERLKDQFHYEDPAVVQYLRWIGALWFVGGDTGLMQGDLGRSMENGDKVNDIVGDRVVLTMMIAACSILMTWALALATGTYSAVKQYTVGDYALTFVSFIGMSVPGFLLALVLIYLAYTSFGISITGLFSPHYAAQPEWSVGKVIDLLQHIWVPILVAGIGGTAGLFRVMRGNLLDELRKPYVTTARSKGVRPIKLLVKYPVRVALNPVISTIGGLFPELVSGSAIVAIVLSLPTVGPLMLTGLMQEDMYLAGSMLMVLSLLGIFGTLVSDLLLLWLDPRIRMEGGSK